MQTAGHAGTSRPVRISAVPWERGCSPTGEIAKNGRPNEARPKGITEPRKKSGSAASLSGDGRASRDGFAVRRCVDVWLIRQPRERAPARGDLRRRMRAYV